MSNVVEFKWKFAFTSRDLVSFYFLDDEKVNSKCLEVFTCFKWETNISIECDLCFLFYQVTKSWLNFPSFFFSFLLSFFLIWWFSLSVILKAFICFWLKCFCRGLFAKGKHVNNRNVYLGKKILLIFYTVQRFLLRFFWREK